MLTATNQKWSFIDKSFCINSIIILHSAQSSMKAIWRYIILQWDPQSLTSTWKPETKHKLHINLKKKKKRKLVLDKNIFIAFRHIQQTWRFTFAYYNCMQIKTQPITIINTSSFVHTIAITLLTHRKTNTERTILTTPTQNKREQMQLSKHRYTLSSALLFNSYQRWEWGSTMLHDRTYTCCHIINEIFSA